MRIKYQWKILSEDGLLKDPKYHSEYYEDNLNGWRGGYATEFEAEEALAQAFAENGDYVPQEVVLVKVYEVR